MNISFSESELKEFIQSPLKARQSGTPGVLQSVEHLEEFDTAHPTDFPPVYPAALIDSVNALPWSTLNPFAPEIEPKGFDQVGFGGLSAPRSWRPAHANIADHVFVTGANAFSSFFLTSPYVPALPIISGIPYTGQLLFGSCSYWDYGYQPNPVFPFGFICVPEAGRGRTKWSRDSTVFAVSAELTVRWPAVGISGPPPWQSGPESVFLKNFQLVKSLSDLSAGTWYEAPIISELRGPFWNGDRLNASDGFLGMFTIPVFFETIEQWQTRTGLTLP